MDNNGLAGILFPDTDMNSEDKFVDRKSVV